MISLQEHLFIVTELLQANLYEFQKFNRESHGEPYFTLNRLQVSSIGLLTSMCDPYICSLSYLAIINLKTRHIFHVCISQQNI